MAYYLLEKNYAGKMHRLLAFLCVSKERFILVLILVVSVKGIWKAE